MLHPRELLRREAIAKYFWHESFDPLSNVIDIYMNRLRKKIDNCFDVHVLHTVRNHGYVLSDLPPQPRASG